MATKSTIEWTEATWNPVVGCSPVSAGCQNCYAARLSLRLEKMGNAVGTKYQGLAKISSKGLPVFTGTLRCDHSALEQPFRWRKPRLVFVNSMSDLFHEEVPTSFIAKIFEVMNNCSLHHFQILTKRPKRVLEIASKLHWSPNIWLGVSVEDEMVIDRISYLAEIPAQVRFLSCEPLIGPLNNLPLQHIDWVIVGGESGPNSRPMAESWVHSIKDQCLESNVAFFFKQWGGTNKKVAGRELSGRTWNDMPAAYSMHKQDGLNEQ